MDDEKKKRTSQESLSGGSTRPDNPEKKLLKNNGRETGNSIYICKSEAGVCRVKSIL